MKPLLTSKQWEANTMILCARVSILDVLHIQLNDFTASYGISPDIVFLAPELRAAFVKEVVHTIGMPSDSAVAEPVWLNRVPILFNGKETAGDYVVLRNGALRLERRL